jgi:hypothetical protein
MASRRRLAKGLEDGGQAGTPAPADDAPASQVRCPLPGALGIVLAVALAAAVAACSSGGTATVSVTTPTYSAPAYGPARAAFILGYNAVASENLRSLLGTPLVHGDPSSDATPKTLCAYEANQTFAKTSPKNAGYAAGCRAALAGKPDTGQ